MQLVRKNDSTSQRSWRQNLAQGEASVASGTLGRRREVHQARLSGRKILSPAKADSEIPVGLIPRAALRFTSFRSASTPAGLPRRGPRACPGLNSAAGYAGSLSVTSTVAACVIVCSLTLACSGKPSNTNASATTTAASTAPSDNYPSLAAQAKEMSDAFARRDYERFADLTYPKVIEMAGGRDKMLAGMTKQIREMEAEGVVMLSSSSGAPTQFVHDSRSIYALLPTTLKVKAKDGVFQSEGSTIAVSSDQGSNWTFIDASGKDHSELKALLPNVADRLKLPAEKPAVKISS